MEILEEGGWELQGSLPSHVWLQDSPDVHVQAQFCASG